MFLSRRQRKNRCLFVVGAIATLLISSPASTDPAEIAAGERLFRSQCMGCHSLGPDENRAGPTLHGLFARQSGTIVGFDFSGAMVEAEIDWSPETLDLFLADPRGLVPGTKMVLWGLEETARRRLIAYLEIATDPERSAP